MWFLLFWTKLELALRVTQVLAVDSADLVEHTAAAVEASTAQLPAELLLAIAYVESRFDATATSRIQGTRRVVGSYPSLTPPRGLRGTLYCGPLQTYAASWRQCLAMREPSVGYTAAARELTKWLRDKRVRGNVTRALLGHGCGNAGLATSQCNGYPQRVLDVMRRLRAAAPPPRATS